MSESQHSAIQSLERAQQVVIKIGSALLVGQDGALRSQWLASVAKDIKSLKASGKDVLIVSSGSVALGLQALGLTMDTGRLEEAQAAAAVGQIQLAQAYQALFAAEGLKMAQLLLTLGDLENRRRYLNARNTVATLMEHDIIPVINENDTVTTNEIRFGDNDRLAARVAQMAGADLLVLLSDINGLYTSDPRLNPSAELIPVVETIDARIDSFAGPPSSSVRSTGGMITKIKAAKMAVATGCSMIIMNGNAEAPIGRLQHGEPCTLFTADTDPLTVRKQWIRGMMAPRGNLTLDAGAIKALKSGASLLPAGLTAVSGTFERGDLVQCIDPEGRIIAQGLVSYDAEDAAKIAGVKSAAISNVLGFAGRTALIHRDDLVLL